MTMKVGHKLVAGFGVVILLILGLGWYQLVGVQAMRDSALKIVEADFEVIRALRTSGNNRRDMATLFQQTVLAYFLKKANLPTKGMAVYEKEWTILHERTRAAIDRLDLLSNQNLKLATAPERRQLWSRLRDLAQAMRQNHDQTVTANAAVIRDLRRDDLTEFQAAVEALQKLDDEADGLGSRAIDVDAQLATAAAQDVTEAHADLRATSIIVLALVLIVAIVVAFVIHRSITGPLRDFMRFVEGIGRGDLTGKLDARRKDELGGLAVHLNDMVASLNSIAAQTRTVTENLNAAAAEMQASVQQQAAGTSEQSAAIQQITTTLSEITRSGNQITDRAKTVAQSAEAAAVASRSGIQAVNETSRVMTGIREQAEKVAMNVVALTEKTQSIGAIIATVNDLSERSNLLALNAAIEAAAAGEHGQSFGVVAEEMKNLAGQAKDATVEVRALLGDIQHRIGTAVMQTEEAVKRVEGGRSQAEATEQTINELARSIEQSVATFEQIVAATGQQQVGIEQVTQSIHSIREASEQMAMGSKEVGQAAANLSALSDQLQRTVARYRI
jgi:methyl-accepting chemotaxis protein